MLKILLKETSLSMVKQIKVKILNSSFYFPTYVYGTSFICAHYKFLSNKIMLISIDNDICIYYIMYIYNTYYVISNYLLMICGTSLIPLYYAL